MKQATREAKLMLESEAAKKDLAKAHMKLSKVVAHIERQNNSIHILQARLAELRAKGPGEEYTPLPDQLAKPSKTYVLMIDPAQVK